jgi:hypothetical protein
MRTTPKRQEEISFDTAPGEALIIRAIAARATSELTVARGHDLFSQMDVAMDVTAVHCNGCPLRLEALRDADGFNFAHDVLGIRRHLNRETAQLGDEFTPRYAQRGAR